MRRANATTTIKERDYEEMSRTLFPSKMLHFSLFTCVFKKNLNENLKSASRAAYELYRCTIINDIHAKL